MSQRVDVLIPAPPSVNELYRNVPGVGRVSTRAYKSWVHTVADTLAWEHRIKPFGVPVKVTIEPAEVLRRDLDNYFKPTLDALVKAGLIPNDNAKHVRELAARWRPKDAPMMRLIVEPFHG